MTVAQVQTLHEARSLRGMIEVPSDKSIAHRALICAALSYGTSSVTLRYPGADVLSTLGALRALGTPIETQATDDMLVAEVHGLGDGDALGRPGSGVADCGNSGTTMRL